MSPVSVVSTMPMGVTTVAKHTYSTLGYLATLSLIMYAVGKVNSYELWSIKQKAKIDSTQVHWVSIL